MNISADLWPADIAKDKKRTPVSILRAQAAHLGQKTSNLVEGRVNTMAREDRIYHRFKLVAPALDNYTYELFRISHPATIYPIRVEEEPDQTQTEKLVSSKRKLLQSEDEFVAWLKSVFASPLTKQVVEALVSQSADWTAVAQN